MENYQRLEQVLIGKNVYVQPTRVMIKKRSPNHLPDVAIPENHYKYLKKNIKGQKMHRIKQLHQPVSKRCLIELLPKTKKVQ